jgi:hypothetical protein
MSSLLGIAGVTVAFEEYPESFGETIVIIYPG